MHRWRYSRIRLDQSLLLHWSNDVPGSSYWNIGIGHAIGEAEDDAEGMATMTTSARTLRGSLRSSTHDCWSSCQTV